MIASLSQKRPEVGTTVPPRRLSIKREKQAKCAEIGEGSRWGSRRDAGHHLEVYRIVLPYWACPTAGSFVTTVTSGSP